MRDLFKINYRVRVRVRVRDMHAHVYRLLGAGLLFVLLMS